MKQSILSKALCTTLAFLLLLQTLPLSVFANDYGFSNNLEPGSSLNITEDESIEIVCEVVANRGEYSKEYLLKDGSFYSVTSPTPLHTLVDGEWIDIYSDLEDTNKINTTDEIVETIQDSATSTYALQRSTVSEYEDSSLIINKLDCIQTPGGGYRFGESSGILMKPASVGNYINKNRIITYAGLSMYCSFVNDGSAELPYVQIYEAEYEWTTDSFPDEYGTETKLVDTLSLDNVGINTWDITDLYSRWDRGVTENNGFCMYNGNENYLMISAPFLVVRYIEVEKNDVDFTYHSLDMGDAGTLYINDCTGAIRIEQKLLDLKTSNSKLNLNRTYDSMLPSYRNYAGIGFLFNYESNLTLNQHYAEWMMINGDVIKFVAANPVVEDGDYRLWTSLGEPNNNNTFELWIKNSEINNLSNYINNVDYRNLYIVANGYKCCFDQHGNLLNVFDNTTNTTILSITYENSRITKIQDIDGTQLILGYSLCSEIGYSYISEIEVKSASNNPVTISDDEPLKINFTTEYNSETQTTTQTTTFSNNDSISYTFDFD